MVAMDEAKRSTDSVILLRGGNLADIAHAIVEALGVTLPSDAAQSFIISALQEMHFRGETSGHKDGVAMRAAIGREAVTEFKNSTEKGPMR
jgi:hypothetical protein